MIEQFNFDIRLIFAILNGKVSAAINRKLSRNFRQNGLEITPEQWTVLIFLWEKDGVTQQELCNATFKDKPSMTRLIDNGASASRRAHIGQERPPNQSDTSDQGRQGAGRTRARHCQPDPQRSLERHHHRRAQCEPGGAEEDFLQYEGLRYRD